LKKNHEGLKKLAKPLNLQRFECLLHHKYDMHATE